MSNQSVSETARTISRTCGALVLAGVILVSIGILLDATSAMVLGGALIGAGVGTNTATDIMLKACGVTPPDKSDSQGPPSDN